MIVKMKDICTKIGSGATPRGGKNAYIDEGISLIRSQNILDFSFSFDGLAFINEDQANKLDGVTVEEDDVMLNITGDSVARACMVDNSVLPARVNQHVCILRASKDKVLSSYILYYLQMKKQELLQLASSGATRKALTKVMIEELELDLPSLEEQKRIISLIDSIQDKLATNNQINRNLSEQALAYFRRLFGDCEKDATVAEVSLNVTDGVHNSVKDDPESNYLLLSCKNIKGGELSIGNSERRISQETFDKLRKRTKLEKGDVLLSSVGTIGELLLVNFEPENIEFQRSVAMIKPNPSAVSSVYLYLALLNQKQEIIHSGHGAVQQCIFIKDISGFSIHKPNFDELIKLNDIVEPMFDAITENQKENFKLVELRDSLLPKLMSGELDVSDLNI